MERNRRAGMEMGNWSELPRDLLSAIARRLAAAADRARFSAVCRNWSSLAKSEINYLPLNPPWLMLTEKPDSDDRDFVGADGKERFELELPKSRGSRCVGSTGCWVVMIDADCDMYILNPFTCAKIDLPSLIPLDKLHFFEEEKNLTDLRDCYVHKVILSFPKSQSPGVEDFIAVAICSSYLRTIFYTVKGAKSWKTIESIHNPFVDVIFYQDKLYAVNHSGIILEFDIHFFPEEKPISDPLMDTLVYQRDLVEFRGLLLQVISLADYNYPDGIETKEFNVFKLDSTTGGWVELNDLGQHSIFLGLNSGVPLLATPNCTFKPNCIYFITNEYVRIWVDGKLIHIGDVGVFNLADSTIVPYYTGPYSGSALNLPVWIVPTSLSQCQ